MWSENGHLISFVNLFRARAVANMEVIQTRYIFLYMCATCTELPYIIMTMLQHNMGSLKDIAQNAIFGDKIMAIQYFRASLMQKKGLPHVIRRIKIRCCGSGSMFPFRSVFRFPVLKFIVTKILNPDLTLKTGSGSHP